MKIFIILNVCLTVLLASFQFSWAEIDRKDTCFFKSDCPHGHVCVTPKGAARGNCQLETIDHSVDSGLGNKSIIDEKIGQCTFNADCPSEGQCVKKPGALYGNCQGGGYVGSNIATDRGTLYKNRSCFFDQDCKIGQACVKLQGSFKGICEDGVYQTNQDENDPRVLLNNSRTSQKKCLTSTDCRIREVCVQKERSVFGICIPQNAVLPASTQPSDIFNPTSNPDSVFQ